MTNQIDYDSKYMHMKEIYKKEKNIHNQKGSAPSSALNESTLNESQKILVDWTSLDYENAIKKLENHCRNKISTYQELVIKIKSIENIIGYNRISNSSLKGQMDQLSTIIGNIPQFFRDRGIDINDIKENKQNINKYFNNKGINFRDFGDKFNNFYKKVCESINNEIIPKLKKERKLQESLITAVKQSSSYIPEIDISKYIEYARDNNLLNDSLNNILHKYNQTIDSYSNYFNREKHQNQSLMNSMGPLAASTGIAAITSKFFNNGSTNTNNGSTNTNNGTTNANNGNIIGTNSVDRSNFENFPLSKSGKQCKNQCESRHDNIRGNYFACNTDPYTSYFVNYDWDYCK